MSARHKQPQKSSNQGKSNFKLWLKELSSPGGCFGYISTPFPMGPAVKISFQSVMTG